MTVHLYDDAGNHISALTDDAGIAVLDPSSDLVGGRYRVQVDNPRPDFFYPAHAANGQSAQAAKITAADLQSATNAKLSTTVEFVDVRENRDAYVNVAFWYPPYYCQENPAICSASQPWSASPPGATSAPTEKTLLSMPYRLNQDDRPLATVAETGAVYGIAYDREHQRIFSAAYAKRGSAYGPGGPGAIYVTDLSTTTFPLTAAGPTSLWATVPNAGDDNHVLNVNHDSDFFDRVGKESLGDIDITNDNRWLFGVNMYDKTVFVFDLETDTYVGSYPIPDPGCANEDDWRPMGVGVGMDTSYVGGVCSGQANQNMDELSAHVWQFDPATGTFGDLVLSEPLTYGRGVGYAGGGCDGTPGSSDVGRWYSWVARFPSVPNEQRPDGCPGGWMAYGTPTLGDIVEETNGDLVISLRDRFTDQAGWGALEQNAAGGYQTSWEPASMGDIVRGCKLTDGTFVLDPNLTPAHDLAPSALCTDSNVAGVDAGGQPRTFREYYAGDHRGGFHDESFYGGIALARSEPNIVGSAQDPGGGWWTQGVAAVHRNGRLPQGSLGQATDDETVDRWGKGTGMADVEVLCDKAPIQIGNRVWFDVDKDGIQDPGEDPIAGATVNLYDADGNLVATTTTSARGEYFFDHRNVPGGLGYLTEYTIRLDDPDDYEPGGPLFGTRPTLANAGDDVELDNDGVAGSDGYPETTLTTGEAGQDDHRHDFGVVRPSVSVVDFVWVDVDRDGVQYDGEPGIPGVTLVITGPDGGPVTDVFGNPVGPVVTNDDGFYEFVGLPALEPGQSYTVSIDRDASADVLAPYIPTIANAGDPAEDSSTWTATSGELTENGDRDPTLDFGFVVPAVSVGDYVWHDVDRDGVQYDGEPGIPGVTLVITGPDGGPVTDVFGNPVGPVVTNDDGFYEFVGLPALEPGQSYTVSIDRDASADVLAPYIPTIANAGDPAEDSSTWTATSGELTENGDRDPTLDFGFVVPAVSVGDYVWHDVDRDGIQDDGEPGIPGVTVTITGPDGGPVTDVFGNPVGPVRTDDEGRYDFPNLPALQPGESYTVTVTTPPGFIPTTPGAGDDPSRDSSTGSASSGDLVDDGDRDDTLDFGFVVPRVSVGDYVWVDTDRDGRQDAGEPGIPGVTLVLTGPDGKPVTDVFGSPVGPVVTDENGFYEFVNLPALPPGKAYTVTIDREASADALAPYVPTVANVGDRAGDSSTWSARSGDLVNDGDRDPTLDFGFVVPAVSVGDLVWLDLDRDGRQDPGEPGIPGVTLTLTGPDGGPVTDVFGNPVGPVVTNENGYYEFPNLPALKPGESYTVTVTPPDGYLPTTPGVGDRAGDSSTGSATSGDLVNDGDRDRTLDFGFIKPAVSTEGKIWRDDDGDGQVDPGEPGIPGVLLELTGPDGKPVTDVYGNPVGPVRTGADGSYEFLNLPPLGPGETYTVSIVTDDPQTAEALAGMDLTTTSWTLTARDLTEDGDRATGLDFGFRPKPTPSVVAEVPVAPADGFGGGPHRPARCGPPRRRPHPGGGGPSASARPRELIGHGRPRPTGLRHEP